MLRSEAHVGIRGQMKNELGTGHALGQLRRVQQIGAYHAEIRRFVRLGQEIFLPRRKVVVANHCVAARQKPVRQRTADEAGATGNKVVQSLPGSFVGLRSKRALTAVARHIV